MKKELCHTMSNKFKLELDSLSGLIQYTWVVLCRYLGVSGCSFTKYYILSEDLFYINKECRHDAAFYHLTSVTNS